MKKETHELTNEKGWAWWRAALVPALKKQRQMDLREFGASLGLVPVQPGICRETLSRQKKVNKIIAMLINKSKELSTTQ